MFSILGKLRDKCKEKRGKTLIDSSLVLRILLEEYKKEKKHRIVIMKKLINNEPNSHLHPTKFSISFESFKNLLLKFFPDIDT